MKNVTEFIYPATVDEAVEALEQGGTKARIIAGGTSVSQSRDSGVSVLVDITRLGLSRIKKEKDALRIDTCATADQIASSEQVRKYGLHALAEAASEVGPAGVRNAVTIGGNVIQCYPWSDLPVALLALETSAVTVGPNEWIWPLVEMFQRHPTKQLKPGDLVIHFLVGKPRAGSGNAFVKFGRTAVDYALVSAAASVELKKAEGFGETDESTDQTWVHAVKVVVGAAKSLPSPVPNLDVLTGKAVRPDDAWRAKVSEVAQATVKPGADIRASAEYRTALVGVMVRRALKRAVKRAVESLSTRKKQKKS
jgi:carbon-monoxide dehydrogenase medium subunit